ncbi:MAG: hypothetical protein RLZZ350_1071 [Verrucomicrobiota bacterium]|jgi:hypothetical protein
MKISRAQNHSAMTLIEMMMAFGVFTMLMTSLFALHLFGFKMNQITLSKLGASDTAREGFSRLLGDVRASSGYQIGTMPTNVPYTNFSVVANGSNWTGNALKLSYATTTNQIIYFFHPTNYALCRYTNGVSGYYTVVTGTTNTSQFRSEDYQGNVQTSSNAQTVVSVFMEFYQLQYPLTHIGTGSNYLYDYYRLELKAASRNYN